MEIHFYKYQATGNDFVLIDNRKLQLDHPNPAIVANLCDRRFGIGSDGVILIENDPEFDFNMIFYNPDGSKSLCGNGSRCVVDFARYLGMIDEKTTFRAFDGPHSATIIDNQVRLKMNDVHSVRLLADGIFVDTGSPHYIQFVSKVKRFNVQKEGKKIRHGPLFGNNGTNVDFVELLNKGQIYVRTYERGVEAETLSCGTGVTACAIAANYKNYESPVEIITPGGKLTVEYKKTGEHDFTEIYLTGPTKMVYRGVMDL